MNLHSFRLKIALLAGLIPGILLTTAGFVLWQAAYQFNLDQLDREIRNVGSANLDRVQGGDHWLRLDDALKFVAGNRSSATFVLWVKNYDKVIYQSSDWPAGLTPTAFHVSQNFEGPNAPQPGSPLPEPPRRGEQISPSNPALPLRSPILSTTTASGKSWRVAALGNPYTTLVLAANLTDFEARMAGLRNVFLIALAATLALVAGSARLIARRALRPVNVLAERTERVTVRGLGQRIPAMPGDTEFNRLVTVFNEMLERLEKSFTQATRFSADASHELKTPLARLQLELEQALDSAPAGSPQQEVFGSLIEEVSRLKAIVQKLLLLCLADAGRLELHREPVNLTRLLENIVEDSRLQAPHLTVEKALAPGVEVQADPDLLEQALQNLAINAVKYNQTGGKIRIELFADATSVVVRVMNTGPGIPAADRERVFERFYRADKSRSTRVEGAGLGLSLSREIIRAHGGELKLESSDTHETRLVVTL